MKWIDERHPISSRLWCFVLATSTHFKTLGLHRVKMQLSPHTLLSLYSFSFTHNMPSYNIAHVESPLDRPTDPSFDRLEVMITKQLEEVSRRQLLIEVWADVLVCSLGITRPSSSAKSMINLSRPLRHWKESSTSVALSANN